MRTLHLGLRVADLERSLAFYTCLGYEVLGEVPATEFGGLTMLKLPGDEFVSLELVHDSACDRVEPGSLHHLVITVEAMRDTWPTSPPVESRPKPRAPPTAPTTCLRPGSPIQTAIASSWSSGPLDTPTG